MDRVAFPGADRGRNLGYPRQLTDALERVRPMIIRHYVAHNGSELTSFYFFASGLTVFTLVAVSLAAALKALTDSTILPYSVIAGTAILFGGGAASGAADLGLIEGAKRGIPVGTA